jgi:hypothetical protein
MSEEQKPKEGAIQIRCSKMRIYLSGAWQDFGVAYVAKDMRKIAKPVHGRKHGYSSILRALAAELDAQGLASVRSVQERLKAFWGASEKWIINSEIVQGRKINRSKLKRTKTSGTILTTFLNNRRQRNVYSNRTRAGD